MLKVVVPALLSLAWLLNLSPLAQAHPTSVDEQLRKIAELEKQLDDLKKALIVSRGSADFAPAVIDVAPRKPDLSISYSPPPAVDPARAKLAELELRIQILEKDIAKKQDLDTMNQDMVSLRAQILQLQTSIARLQGEIRAMAAVPPVVPPTTTTFLNPSTFVMENRYPEELHLFVGGNYVAVPPGGQREVNLTPGAYSYEVFSRSYGKVRQGSVNLSGGGQFRLTALLP